MAATATTVPTATSSPTLPSRERRKRHDGTDIDPVKNLAEFLEGIPASDAEPAEEPAAPPVAPPAPVQLQVPLGPTPEQIIAEERGKRETAERELERVRSQSQIDDAARRAVAEQQRTPPPPQQAPPPDPRLAEIQENWFTDPARSQQLMAEINNETMTAQIEKARGMIRQELTTEQQTTQRREQGNAAFHEFRRRLAAEGVSQADLDNHYKVGAIYQAVTMPPSADRPNPYYAAGGPLSADVLVKAWKDILGSPAAAPTPPPALTPPSPPIVAPPGSSRPAPAATPPQKERATPVSSADQRDLTYLAEALGHKPENLINRRRARLEREKGNQ